MTFNDCLTECCQNHELVKQFDRLQGSNLSRILIRDTRPPIVRMIDEASGYQKFLDEKAHEDMQAFITFCFAYIWCYVVDEVEVR